MRVHNFQQTLFNRVIDLDTGNTVPAIIWVDVEQGLLEAYQLNALGRVKKDPTDGGLLTYTAKGRFKVVPLSHKPTPPRVVMGAPRCVKCGNPLTLPGSDLCAPCNALDRNFHNKMHVERVVDPLALTKCEKCDRPAEYAVSDEVEVTPALAGKFLWERGATVGRHHYCSFHFQPPRLLDPKGEVMETFESAHGVRPE